MKQQFISILVHHLSRLPKFNEFIESWLTPISSLAGSLTLTTCSQKPESVTLSNLWTSLRFFSLSLALELLHLSLSLRGCFFKMKRRGHSVQTMLSQIEEEKRAMSEARERRKKSCLNVCLWYLVVWNRSVWHRSWPSRGLAWKQREVGFLLENTRPTPTSFVVSLAFSTPCHNVCGNIYTYICPFFLSFQGKLCSPPHLGTWFSSFHRLALSSLPHPPTLPPFRVNVKSLFYLLYFPLVLSQLVYSDYVQLGLCLCNAYFRLGGFSLQWLKKPRGNSNSNFEGHISPSFIHQASMAIRQKHPIHTRAIQVFNFLGISRNLTNHSKNIPGLSRRHYKELFL